MNSTQPTSNDDGDKKTPLYVAFTATERLIGEAAKKQADMDPINIVYDGIHLIGRSYNDPVLQSYTAKWPFKVVNTTRGKPKIEVVYSGQRQISTEHNITASGVYTRETGFSHPLLPVLLKTSSD